MSRNRMLYGYLASFMVVAGNALLFADTKLPIPTAILPFEVRGDASVNVAQVADLLYAQLLVSQNIVLVERQAIKHVFDELKLSKAGLVRTEDATHVGKLTGAKLLITGSLIQVNNDLYLVAKVISTETSRLTGASVKGTANADLGKLVEQLAAQVDIVVANKAESLLPKVISSEDWLTSTKKQLAGKKLPSVTVKIAERHIGQVTFDPAAQNECEHLLTELGFTVIATDNANSDRADLIIQGEAMSQFASLYSELSSVKCRVEVRVVSQASGNILASDAETTIAIDLAEQIAAKSGLQAAARTLLERLLPKFLK